MDTINVYPTSVYGVSELPHTRKGFRYATINPKSSNIFDVYTRDVATAKTVLSIRKINVSPSESIPSVPIIYRPERITR